MTKRLKRRILCYHGQDHQTGYFIKIRVLHWLAPLSSWGCFISFFPSLMHVWSKPGGRDFMNWIGCSLACLEEGNVELETWIDSLIRQHTYKKWCRQQTGSWGSQCQVNYWWLMAEEWKYTATNSVYPEGQKVSSMDALFSIHVELIPCQLCLVLPWEIS